MGRDSYCLNNPCKMHRRWYVAGLAQWYACIADRPHYEQIPYGTRILLIAYRDDFGAWGRAYYMPDSGVPIPGTSLQPPAAWDKDS